MRHGDGSPLHLPELLRGPQQYAALPAYAAVFDCWVRLHTGGMCDPHVARKGRREG